MARAAGNSSSMLPEMQTAALKSGWPRRSDREPTVKMTQGRIARESSTVAGTARSTEGMRYGEWVQCLSQPWNRMLPAPMPRRTTKSMALKA